MAILRGFPPSNIISPSVRISEQDLSFIAPEQNFHRAGVIGFASKGPINVPTLVQTVTELHRKFGHGHPDVGDPYLVYAGEQYLQVATDLWVVRVGDEDQVSDERAQIASVDVAAAGGQVIIQGNVPETFTFVGDHFFKWKLNGVLASKTLVVLGDDTLGTVYTCSELVDSLNDQLVPTIDGIEFFCNGATEIGVRTTFAYGPSATLELVSVANAIYGGNDPTDDLFGGLQPEPGAITGLGTGMTRAVAVGANDRYPNDGYQTAGVWDFTGLTDLNLQIVIDGTDSVLIDNINQVVDLANLEGLVNTSTDIVNEINNQIDTSVVPGGFRAHLVGGVGPNIEIKTVHHGRDARMLIKVESTASAIFGFDNLTKKGTSPSGISGDVAVSTFGIVSGTVNTGLLSFTATADSSGVDGNVTQFVVTNDTTQNTFNIEVYTNGAQVEAWGNLSKDTNSYFYVGTYLAQVSDYLRISDNLAVGAPPANGTYSLSGGTDGIPSDPDEQDDLIIGSDVGLTGMFSLSEPEQIDIDLVAVPGHSSTSVILSLISLCQDFRQDCLALIDPPFGLTVTEIVHWQNGVHPLNTERFDTDFAALYWPWVKIRDTFNRVNVWAPPSGSVMAAIARSDTLAAPWFAPAGTTRGICPGVLDVFTRPTLAERDEMYGNRNAINPIIQFVDVSGFLIWGQKTLQRRPTALDRVNVRRMLFVAEKRIRAACRDLLFEPNDAIFKARFESIVGSILNEIKIGRGITDFIIRDDETLNTTDVIDRNEFRANIGIQPTKAVEFIFLQFTINRTGSFAETSDSF
jgi:hypothetical protein